LAVDRFQSHNSKKTKQRSYLNVVDALVVFAEANNQSKMTTQPNPPRWPDSVKIFHPHQGKNEILAAIKQTEDPYNAAFNCYTTDNHFSLKRHALLFAPGTYEDLDFEVGYYVQAAGLGRSPDDVQFVNCEKGPFVEALDQHVHQPHGLSLDTFWRSAENFAAHPRSGTKWAVSQAAPLRNVHIKGDLHLHDGAAYASGGHIANSKIDGNTYFGGQQQYMCRNIHFGNGVSGGAWSLVFTGCTGNVPRKASGTSTSSSNTVTAPHVRVEKPYIAMKDDGVHFELCIPKATMDPSKVNGASWNENDMEIRDFQGVFVADPADADVNVKVQQALDGGLDVVFAPGVYHLKQTIQIRNHNAVVLGLGLATLMNPADNNGPCIQVMENVHGVRIAGLMLEVSPRKLSQSMNNNDHQSALLEWGAATSKSNANMSTTTTTTMTNPGAMFDIFCRVGGASGDREAVSINTMMKISSNNVIGDNIWLWRADHSELAAGEIANYPQISPVFWQNEESEAQVQTGLQVDGDDVTIYGLAVEHTNGHQTIWNGERGCVHFYQCELPYDVDPKYAQANYRGYLIAPHVKEHRLYAPGVYSNFRNHNVLVATAIEHPAASPGIHIENPFTVHLNNNGTIMSIVNGAGDPAIDQGKVVRLQA